MTSDNKEVYKTTIKENINWSLLFSIAKKYWVGIFLFILYIFGLPIALNALRKFYHCQNEADCRVWASGFERIIHYSIGAILGLYIGLFIYRIKFSKLMLILFPVVFVLYSGGLLIAFMSFIKISPNHIQFRDITNKVSLTTLSIHEITDLVVCELPRPEGGNYKSTYIIKNGYSYGIGFGLMPLEYISYLTKNPIKYLGKSCKLN